MSNVALIAGVPLGTLSLLFLLWKKLKEDYSSAQIFSFGFIVAGFLLFGFLLGLFIQNKLTPSAVFNPGGIWFWLSFMFTLIGFAFGLFTQKGGKDFKPRFYELVEGVGGGFIAFLIPLFFLTAVIDKNLKTFGFTFLMILLLYFYSFLSARYKSFSWYKSGKVGFAGLATLGIYFFMRCVVAIIDPSMLSFMGKLDAVISILISFIFFISLYRLSENYENN